MKRGYRWVIILVFFLMICQVQLGASESVRIGYSLVVPDSLRNTAIQNLGNYIQRDITRYEPSDSYVQLMNDRLEHEQFRSHLAEIQKSDYQEAQHPFVFTTEEASAFTWEALELPHVVTRALASGDTAVADFIMKSHRLEALLICVLEPLESIYRLRIDEFRSDGSVVNIYETVTLRADEENAVLTALLPILSYYGSQDAGVVSIQSNTPGLSLDINGEEFPQHTQHIVLPVGTYELHATAPEREERVYTIDLASGEIVSLDINLPVLSGNPLLITSYHTLDIVIPQITQTQVPVLIQEISPPFVVYARKQGEPVRTIHVAESTEEIYLSLQPPWMDSVHGSMRSQSAVYASLGRTLLLGGLTVLIDSISRSMASYTGSTSPWQPALIASSGALALSLFDTGVRLFAYYQKTKYSSRY